MFKSEARISNLETISNDQNPNDRNGFDLLNFSNFVFVSNFPAKRDPAKSFIMERDGFRASCLKNLIAFVGGCIQ
jgi:hypothetical protein